MQRARAITGAPRRAHGAGAATAAGFALGALAAVSPARAQPPTSELGAYLTLATDARSRGLSQVDGELAARAGVDYQHTSGFFAGGVLGNVGYADEAAAGQSPDVRLELYAGYLWRGTDWSITTSLGRYRYPGTGADYDYGELSAVIDFRNRYFYRISYSDDLLLSGYGATNHELGVSLPVPGGLELGAALGRFDAGAPYTSDYTHYNVGLSRLVGRFGLDLRRYGTSRQIADYIGSSDGDRWVFSLSYAIHPRP